jgi:hypothetical protein
MSDFLKKLNIVNNINEFNSFPRSVKNGIIFTFGGWIWFFLLYLLFFKMPVPVRQMISGFLACYCILMLRNWARVLCVLCNIFIIMQMIALAVAFFHMGKAHLGAACGLSIILFALSSFFLMVKESREFFKSKSPAPPIPEENQVHEPVENNKPKPGQPEKKSGKGGKKK